MKIRNSFVTNSSSSSFIVSAKTPEALEIINILKEATRNTDSYVSQADLQEIIEYAEYDENYELAERLRKLEESKAGYLISTESYEQTFMELILVLCRKINGLDLEADLN